jgi:hypothetical protein
VRGAWSRQDIVEGCRIMAMRLERVPALLSRPPPTELFKAEISNDGRGKGRRSASVHLALSYHGHIHELMLASMHATSSVGAPECRVAVQDSEKGAASPSR